MSVHISSAVWKLKIDPSQKLLLLALSDMANDEGYCWPSVASLEGRTGLSERTIRSKIQELELAGHLEKSERSGRSTVYRVTPHQADQLALLEGGDGCKSRRGANLAGVQPPQAGGATAAPGGATVAGGGCKSRTHKHQGSVSQSPKDPGAKNSQGVNNSGSTKSSRHASHQEFQAPDWKKRPIDRERLHAGMQALKAIASGAPEGTH